MKQSQIKLKEITKDASFIEGINRKINFIQEQKRRHFRDEGMDITSNYKKQSLLQNALAVLHFTCSYHPVFQRLE